MRHVAIGLIGTAAYLALVCVVTGVAAVAYEVDAPAAEEIIASDDPVPTPEPAPKLLTFEQVMGYQLRWQQKQEEYLRQGGWRMDEANPGQFFLWHIEHKGIRYAMGRDDAIYVQARIERDAAQAALERQIEQSTGIQ